MRKGKIKFSHVNSTGRGTKTDYFRVCQDIKEKSGDWALMPGFEPQLRELQFFFPFKKMENNVKISYSGFCQLPIDGRKNGPKGSYFVSSDGLDSPLYARPDGHSGMIYDGRDGKFLLTQERLDNWSMVKKRLSLIMVPYGWSPTEHIAWSTTSGIAMDYIINEYMSLQTLLRDDLCMLPLTFRAIGKQFKNRAGLNVKFSFGTIGFTGSPFELKEAATQASKLKEFFEIDKIEAEFERDNYFYIDEDDNTEDLSVIEQVDEQTGEVAYVDKETGKEVEPPKAANINPEDILQGLLSDSQIKTLIALAKKHERLKDIVAIETTAKALSMLNELVSIDNRHSKKGA